MTTNRKVILFISMSLDGYIAKRDDNIDFLSVVDQAGEDYGYFEFIKSTDTVIIGRKTYDNVVAMGFEYPHHDKDVYIITRHDRPVLTESTFRFYSGDLKELIIKLKEAEGKHIYSDGGAEIVNELLREDLIDEFVISIIPVLLGDGIPLFKSGRPESQLKLINSTHYEKGLVQVHYERIRQCGN